MIEPGSDSKATARDPGLMPPWFGLDYVHGAVKPFFMSSLHMGDPLALPMIDLAYSKENAVPPHIWGMLYDGWKPETHPDGVSVFFQGYENRGPDNERKRIYVTATTPDLYEDNYAGKVGRFLDVLLDPSGAGVSGLVAARALQAAGKPYAAWTAVGAQSLLVPGARVEVKATAVVPR